MEITHAEFGLPPRKINFGLARHSMIMFRVFKVDFIPGWSACSTMRSLPDGEKAANAACIARPPHSRDTPAADSHGTESSPLLASLQPGRIVRTMSSPSDHNKDLKKCSADPAAACSEAPAASACTCVSIPPQAPNPEKHEDEVFSPGR